MAKSFKNSGRMRSMKIAVMISAILILALSECKTQNNKVMIDKTTVQSLDIKRYLGTWYEIGRYQHSFEINLAGVTATYTQKENGLIEVLNKGFYKSLEGKEKIAKGKAKLSGQPGQLKVSFFLFFYADYNILELDQEGYQWVLIGSSTPGYLWILARTPSISDALYQEIVKKAAERGYDTTKIFKVPQKLPS